MGAISTTINLNDGLTSVIQNMFKSVNYLNDALQSTDELVKGSFDNTALNAARESMAKAVASAGILENSIRELSNTSNAAKSSFEWSSISTMPTFDTSGIQRARQEFSALESSVLKVSETQNKLTQEISGMNLLPKNAIQEINIVNSRISSISSTIAKLEKEKNKLGSWNTSGINAYNSKIESLREKMFQAEKEQEAINRAVKDNNAEKINASYSRLVSIIGSAEGEIKKNTTAQNNFNSSILSGSKNVNNLYGKIKGFASAYLGVQGSKMIMGATDTYSNNTARLGLITDSQKEQIKLQDMIYKSAQRSRGAYNDTISDVAKLGLLAKDAFGNNNEIVAFTELMNKAFKISGAGTQERQAGMYQLTQAMASGRLQGDEFRSIIENAPMLANAIAKYTGVGMDGLKEMSKEGTISASIIKNSLFSAANDIEAKYATMPMTFGEVWTKIKNSAVKNFSPVMSQISKYLNSNNGKLLIDSIEKGTVKLAEISTTVFNATTSCVDYIIKKWNIIQPILTGVASGFVAIGIAVNAIKLHSFITSMFTIHNLLAALNPTNLMLGGIGIAAVAAGIGFGWLSNKVGGTKNAMLVLKTSSAAVFSGIKLGLSDLTGHVFNIIYQIKIGFQEIPQIIKLAFYSGCKLALQALENMINGVIGMLNNFNSTINSTFGTKLNTNIKGVDFSGAIDSFATKANGAINTINSLNRELEVVKAGTKEFFNEQLLIEGNKMAERAAETNKAIEDAFNGNSEAKKVEENIYDLLKGYNFGSNLNNIGDVNKVKNVGGTVDIASEDLKYLRDIAEQEAINQFTTKMVVPDVKITFTGDIKETADVGVISEAVKESIISELNSGAEFAHA